MNWKVTLGVNEFINSLNLYVLPDLRSPVMIGVHLLSLQQRGLDLFGDRLSGTYNKTGENKYVIAFNNIQYNEIFTFQLKVVFEKKDLVLTKAAANIKIKDVVRMLFLFMIFKNVNLKLFSPLVSHV